MAQQVNVSGVGILEFPDGMSDADMAAAIQKNFPQIHSRTNYGNPAESGTESYLDLGSMSIKQRPSSPFVAGIGKALSDTARGVEQFVRQAWANQGPDKTYNPQTGQYEANPADVQAQQANSQKLAALNQDISNSRNLDKPLMSTTGGKAGQFAGDAALLATAPEGLAGSIGGGAALAGAQPTSGDESRLTNTALGAAGGAAGYGVGRALGAAIQPITDRLSALGQQFRAILTREGVPLDAAQATGSKVVTTLKNAAGDSPVVDNSNFPQQQAQQFTRATLEKMGVQNATEASPAVMQAGRQRLKESYNQIAARNTITYDPPLNQDISRIRYDADRNLTPENARVIQNRLDDLETMMQNNGGQMTGAGYEQFQSSLGKIAKDGGKAPFVTDIRQALTGALQRQSSPGDAALLAQTNQRYAAMKAIQNSIDSNTNMVSPSALYNSLDTAKGANGTVYGQGANQPLIQLAQAGKALIGSTRTPNSGTAQRVLGAATLGTGGDALLNLAQGKTQNAEEMFAVAAMAGLSGTAARQLVYSQAGRQWLQRWAQSRVAAAAARQAGRLSQIAGGAVAPSIDATDPQQ